MIPIGIVVPNIIALLLSSFLATTLISLVNSLLVDPFVTLNNIVKDLSLATMGC
jgi:hypothetical protein